MSKELKLLLFANLFLFIFTNHSSNDSLNCYSDSLLSNNFKNNYKLNQIWETGPLKRAADAIKEEFLHFVESMYDYRTNVDDYLYDLIESIDKECYDFLFVKFFFNETDFMRSISKKLLGSGGLIQNSIGTEEDCLDDNGVYILFTGENNRNDLRKEGTFKSDELLFREMKYIRQEVCIFKECRHFYKPLIEYLFKYQNEIIKTIFNFNNFKIAGINFINITEEEMVKNTKEEQEKVEKEKNYFGNVKSLLIVSIIFIISLSIISWFMEGSRITFRDASKMQEDIEEEYGGYMPEEEEEIKKKRNFYWRKKQ